MEGEESDIELWYQVQKNHGYLIHPAVQSVDYFRERNEISEKQRKTKNCDCYRSIFFSKSAYISTSFFWSDGDDYSSLVTAFFCYPFLKQ
mmetsp:Transcript_3987/g.5830  ORF Transcript_3987/g.5830 Transcript_3987/m.5830 type:complete len:90 (+) Transcript_3987:3021-3290(+)